MPSLGVSNFLVTRGCLPCSASYGPPDCVLPPTAPHVGGNCITYAGGAPPPSLCTRVAPNLAPLLPCSTDSPGAEGKSKSWEREEEPRDPGGSSSQIGALGHTLTPYSLLVASGLPDGQPWPRSPPSSPWCWKVGNTSSISHLMKGSENQFCSLGKSSIY